MGTKSNPSEFDAYASALPDEPMFVLLGRDRMAGSLVRKWALARVAAGEKAAKVGEAIACADQLDAWCRGLGKEPINLMVPDDMPDAQTTVSMIDIANMPAVELGHQMLTAVVLPTFGRVTHELNAQENVKLWAGFLAATFGAMAANLGVDGAAGVIEGVREAAIKGASALEGATTH